MEKLTENAGEFLFFAGRVAFNSISVAVHEHLKDENSYVLIAERDNETLGVCECTIEEYDNLKEDYYNQLVRFLEAAKLCGLDFFGEDDDEF